MYYKYFDKSLPFTVVVIKFKNSLSKAGIDFLLHKTILKYPRSYIYIIANDSFKNTLVLIFIDKNATGIKLPLS